MREIFVLISFVTLVSVVSSVCCEGLQCRDEENNPVDWYVIYKLPKLKPSDNKLIENGYAYLYITSDVDKGWILSSKSINDSGSLPGRTMDQLYKSCSLESNSTLWLIYNDEPVNGSTSFELGHTKGIVVANTDGGFWLVHSVPKFPPVPCTLETYSYPSTGLHYGQSFLCISMVNKSLDVVGLQLQYNEPDLYSSHIPLELQKMYPNLLLAAQKKWVVDEPWFHKATITSKKGVFFQSFSKSHNFGKDIYADLVATDLRSNLLVESWQNGEGKLPSDCKSIYMVENIADIKFSTIEPNIGFRSSKDHSKWTVTAENGNPWVCVGDINRMESQKKRGGGTICTFSQQLWSAYRNIVEAIDLCPKYKNGGESHKNTHPIPYLLFIVIFYNIVIQIL